MTRFATVWMRLVNEGSLPVYEVAAGKGTSMPEVYQFRVSGRLSDELLTTFDPARVVIVDDDTVFVRVVRDRGELFGVIARCETLGLALTAFGPAELADPTMS